MCLLYILNIFNIFNIILNFQPKSGVNFLIFIIESGFQITLYHPCMAVKESRWISFSVDLLDLKQKCSFHDSTPLLFSVKEVFVTWIFYSTSSLGSGDDVICLFAVCRELQETHILGDSPDDVTSSL